MVSPNEHELRYRSEVFRALLIAEIFQNVCSFSSTGTLLSLAQSCKIFHTPAIQALWSTLPDLVPLVTCFPRDAVSRVPGSTFPDGDYTTLLKYGSYVKAIGKGPSLLAVSRISLGLLQAICALRPTMVILPNVRELNTGPLGMGDTCLPYLLSVIGKELVNVNIDLHGDDELDPEGTAAAVATLLTTQPHLRAFSYSQYGGDPISNTSTFSTLLRDVPPLTTFLCNAVTVSPEDVLSLSRLHTLRTIHIRLPDTMEWSPVPVETQPFCRVSSFSVTSAALSYRRFAEAYKLPQIRKFSLYLTRRPHPPELSTLFTSIRKQFDPAILTSLEVKDSGTPTFADAQIAAQLGVNLVPGHIRPLFDFRKLREFTFLPAWCYTLYNGFYLDMAKAWPHIKELRFAHMFWCLHEPLPASNVTMEALSYFAAHCPELTTLAIMFDASAWVALPESMVNYGDHVVPASFYSELQGRPSTSKLELLWVDRYPVYCAPAVALYLMRLFPRLTWLWCDDPDPEDVPDPVWGRLWEDIEGFMPVMAEMRNIGESIGRAAAMDRTLGEIRSLFERIGH
ncbi:hypothetical protein C8Q80DRAFT_1095516 [Daedaleopsis nitida]|nr:hypothetical protein C8Q80DRAFT_1095516 [Daedaleopsis nitida]